MDESITPPEQTIPVQEVLSAPVEATQEQSVPETAMPVIEDIGPQTVDFNPPFRKKISRWFILRQFRMFIMIWPLYIWVFWLGIIIFIHFWYKLLLGKRCEIFWQSETRFMRHLVKWYAYIGCIVDKRPKFIED